MSDMVWNWVDDMILLLLYDSMMAGRLAHNCRSLLMGNIFMLLMMHFATEIDINTDIAPGIHAECSNWILFTFFYCLHGVQINVTALDNLSLDNLSPCKKLFH